MYAARYHAAGTYYGTRADNYSAKNRGVATDTGCLSYQRWLDFPIGFGL
jgi:hypothetical protein